MENEYYRQNKWRWPGYKAKHIATHPGYRPGQRKKARSRYPILKVNLLEVFGPFCGFCGETDQVVLEFDHVIPIRRKDARLPSSVAAITAGMRRGTVSPFSIQVLCANCHKRKTDTEKAAYLMSDASSAPEYE